MKPCNFLIMDDPANHLGTLAKESLKTALEEFEGTVLLVSHEEAFYCEWTQKVINIVPNEYEAIKKRLMSDYNAVANLAA